MMQLTIKTMQNVMCQLRIFNFKLKLESLSHSHSFSDLISLLLIPVISNPFFNNLENMAWPAKEPEPKINILTAKNSLTTAYTNDQLLIEYLQQFAYHLL